jgi:hypothetical protein
MERETVSTAKPHEEERYVPSSPASKAGGGRREMMIENERKEKGEGNKTGELKVN